MTLSRVLHGPALTMTTDVKDGREKIPVDIDFAVVIEAGLPFTASSGWPRSGALWPSREKVELIKSKGINVVAKKNFFWLLSFAELEKCLVWDIDKDGGCRKKVHRIMKTLFHKANVKGKNELSSYMLKVRIVSLSVSQWSIISAITSLSFNPLEPISEKSNITRVLSVVVLKPLHISLSWNAQYPNFPSFRWFRFCSLP